MAFILENENIPTKYQWRRSWNPRCVLDLCLVQVEASKAWSSVEYWWACLDHSMTFCFQAEAICENSERLHVKNKTQ